MSTSLLYHAFGVRGYRYQRTEYDGGMVLFHVVPAERTVCCPACSSRNVTRRGSKERWFRNLPVGSRVTWVIAELPRVECHDCHAVRQIEIGFAERRRTYTKAWARYALELTRRMTIKDVADALGVTWDVVKEIKKTYLHKRLLQALAQRRNAYCRRRDLHRQRTAIPHDRHRLGDRCRAIRRGRQVLRRIGSVLAPLETQSSRIEAVAIDMSSAYILAVQTHLPDAAIVFDHFHVVKLMNEKLTALRRDLFREATAQLDKDVLKGTRWLLLKNPENLNEEKNELARLEEALRLNAPFT